MYLTTQKQLNQELASRRAKQQEIAHARDEFIRGMYGIDNFSTLVAQYLGVTEQTVAVLARQVPSVTIEEVTAFVLGRVLGLSPLALAFYSETFVINNKEKLSRLKMPWLSWSKKGNQILHYETVVAEPFENLVNRVFSNISTTSGTFLPEHHLRLRAAMFSDAYPCYDASDFFRQILQTATNKPLYFFLEKDGYVIKSADWDSITTATSVRPPASWYYPLFLSLFLDGRMVLLETYESAKYKLSSYELQLLVTRSASVLTAAIGVTPLVVRLPDPTLVDYYCNRHLVERGLEAAFLEPLEHAPKNDIVQLGQQITKRALAYR